MTLTEHRLGQLVLAVLFALTFIGGALVGSALKENANARIEDALDDVRDDVKTLIGRTAPGPHVWRMPRDPYPPSSRWRPVPEEEL